MAALRPSARDLPWWVLPFVARARCPQPTPHSARLSTLQRSRSAEPARQLEPCLVLRRRFKACRTTSCYLVISFDLVWQMSRSAGVAWPAARPHLTACAHVPGSMALRTDICGHLWRDQSISPSLLVVRRRFNLAVSFSHRRRRRCPISRPACRPARRPAARLRPRRRLLPAS